MDRRWNTNAASPISNRCTSAGVAVHHAKVHYAARQPGAEDDRSTCDVFVTEGYEFRDGSFRIPNNPWILASHRRSCLCDERRGQPGCDYVTLNARRFWETVRQMKELLLRMPATARLQSRLTTMAAGVKIRPSRPGEVSSPRDHLVLMATRAVWDFGGGD